MTLIDKKTIEEELEKEVPTSLFDIFRKNRIRCVIIYEDGSYGEFFKKLEKPYTMTINKRDYLMDTRCILRGKFPTICWYFNNPLPISFEFQNTKLTSAKLVEPAKLKRMSDEKKQIYANVRLDSEALHSALTSRLFKGLYDDGSKLNAKSFLVVVIVIAVILIIILQMTGVIDIASFVGVRR